MMTDSDTMQIVKTSSWGRHIPSSMEKFPDVCEFLEYVQCNSCKRWTLKMHSAEDFDFCPNCGCYMKEDNENG